MQPTTNLSEGTGYAGAYQHIYLILSFEMHKLILKHLTTLPSTPMSPIAGIVICHKGASIYDVRKILGFLDPPPPFVRILCTVCPQNWGIFCPPLSADVIYGSPLSRLRLAWRVISRVTPTTTIAAIISFRSIIKYCFFAMWKHRKEEERRKRWNFWRGTLHACCSTELYREGGPTGLYSGKRRKKYCICCLIDLFPIFRMTSLTQHMEHVNFRC